MKKSWPLIVAMVLVLANCSKKPQSRLPGIWVHQGPDVKTVWVLAEDDTFKSVLEADKNFVVIKGQWQVEGEMTLKTSYQAVDVGGKYVSKAWAENLKKDLLETPNAVWNFSIQGDTLLTIVYPRGGIQKFRRQ